MKKVIEGKLYNTDTAKLLGAWSNEARSFNYVKEELYRTKAGAYFLYGEGGAMTQYAVSTSDNNWTGGEQIHPMSPSAARKWAEGNLSADEYIAQFGEPSEAEEGKRVINLSLSNATIRKLELIREETGVSISQIIEKKFN